MKRLLVTVSIVLGSALAASGQTITSYEIRYYDQGAASPRQVQPFPAGVVACAQAPAPAGTSTVNPTHAEWADPAASGQVCRVDLAAGAFLPAFPIGSYQATLVALNAAGPSGESNRAPFLRVDPPVAPSNLMLIRVGGG